MPLAAFTGLDSAAPASALGIRIWHQQAIRVDIGAVVLVVGSTATPLPTPTDALAPQD